MLRLTWPLDSIGETPHNPSSNDLDERQPNVKPGQYIQLTFILDLATI